MSCSRLASAENCKSGPGLTERRRARRAKLLLFLAVFGAAALVDQRLTGWNVNSRLSLVLAVVDRGTFKIDAYHDEAGTRTYDKAYFKGHYYSDKVFGVSLLATPVYKAMTLIQSGFGTQITLQQVNYFLRLTAVSIPAALFAVLLWRLMVRLGAAPRRAMVAVGFSVFGTLFFGYSTVFYPYAPAIFCSLAGLYLVLFPPASRLTLANSFAIGFSCGFALLCDFNFGLVVAGVASVFLIRLAHQTGLIETRAFADMEGPREPPRRSLSLLLIGGLGGAIPLALFAAYSLSIFGELTTAYRYEVLPFFRTNMAKGFMGATVPRLGPLWFLTIHPYRGIFFWSPIMIGALAGLILAARLEGRSRIVGWLGLWSFAAYLLFNAAYFAWWGGAAMGPRHLLPIMATVPLGLAYLCRPDRHRAWFAILVVQGIASVALTMPVSVIQPQLRARYPPIVLQKATPATELNAPQFEVLRTVYGGDLPHLLERRGTVHIIGPILAALTLTWMATYCCPKTGASGAGRT